MQIIRPKTPKDRAVMATVVMAMVLFGGQIADPEPLLESQAWFFGGVSLITGAIVYWLTWAMQRKRKAPEPEEARDDG